MLNFRDCFQTVWAEFSGLFLDSPDIIFGTVFEQSRTMIRFGFDPGLMSSDFVVCFGITPTDSIIIIIIIIIVIKYNNI